MIALLMAGALLAAQPAPPAGAGAQDPVAPQSASVREEPVTLADIVVTGRPLESLIQDFVGEVAEPNRGRGLARWNRRVCVGVANLKIETAQYLVDRISTVATDIGLEPGAPGCTPNILVVATADGGELAAALVDKRRRAFRMGGAGMDRGGTALRDFVESDRPVRWWQMSIPTDSESGQRAVRISGECNNACTGVNDYAPNIAVFAASRLRTQIVDNLARTIVIVDVDEVAGLSTLQLADYIAMVSLAQIDPDADTRRYATILNVFNDPDSSANLTDWDQTYLEGLYDAERNQVNRRANRREIVNSIRRAHADARADDRGEAVATD